MSQIWALLADIVLAKFHFLEERPDIALSLLTSAAMDTEVFLASTSPRAVRLVAEGFALKGMDKATVSLQRERRGAVTYELLKSCFSSKARSLGQVQKVIVSDITSKVRFVTLHKMAIVHAISRFIFQQQIRGRKSCLLVQEIAWVSTTTSGSVTFYAELSGLV